MAGGERKTGSFRSAPAEDRPTGSFRPVVNALPVEDVLRVEEACDTFEGKWRLRGRPDVLAAALGNSLYGCGRPSSRNSSRLDVYYRRSVAGLKNHPLSPTIPLVSPTSIRTGWPDWSPMWTRTPRPPPGLARPLLPSRRQTLASRSAATNYSPRWPAEPWASSTAPARRVWTGWWPSR